MLDFAAVQVSDSLQTALDSFVGFLPKLLGFLVVLAIGWLIAKLVKTAVTKLLENVGLDRALHSGSTGRYVDKVAPDTRPSSVIGTLAFWFIFLGAIAIAVSQLGIEALDTFVASIGGYLPNVIAAVLIFVVAGAVAAAIGGLVARTMGDTPTGKIIGSVVPVLVMAIATFMILNQLRIAPQIVTITYAALLGAAALAMALAFGLGGRDVAARMLSDAYDKGREQRGQIKRDLEIGKQRGKQDAERVGQAAERRAGNGQAAGARPGATAAHPPGA
jgi:hypothetical protein